MADTPEQDHPQDTGEGTQAEIDALDDPVGDGEAEVPASEPADGGGFSREDFDTAFDAVAAAAGEAPAGDDAPEDQGADAQGTQFDTVAAAMAAAIDQDRTVTGQDAGLVPDVVELPDFGEGSPGEAGALQSIDLLHDVDLRVRIELGRTRMYVEDVLRLGEGSVVELDKLAGDPVDVFVNERLVARGEVLVLNDNFCVRVSEIISDENERALLT